MLRDATAADAAFLEAMLLEAVNWDASRAALSLDAVRREPDLAHYVAGWPRPGDHGIVAEDDDHPGTSLGAAWYRYFAPDEPGYGFVATDVPEVSVGVVADHRGRGVGTALLRGLHDAARRAGLARLSLSVERANPAVALYERLGYRPVGPSDGGSITMVVDL